MTDHSDVSRADLPRQKTVLRAEQKHGYLNFGNRTIQRLWQPASRLGRAFGTPEGQSVCSSGHDVSTPVIADATVALRSKNDRVEISDTIADLPAAPTGSGALRCPVFVISL